jgi:hypothetical protein
MSTIESFIVVKIVSSLKVPVAAAPILLLITGAIVHAGHAAGLTLNRTLASTETIVALKISASTVALTARAYPLILTAPRTIGATTITVATTAMVAASPCVEADATKVETPLAVIAIHWSF